jgi:hypothetical protein
LFLRAELPMASDADAQMALLKQWLFGLTVPESAGIASGLAEAVVTRDVMFALNGKALAVPACIMPMRMAMETPLE